MSYRPITDVWILARSKVKFYGAYPSGFLSRARTLLGAPPTMPVLHVCGGLVKHYPYKGVYPCDRTLDLDPATHPDYLQDALDAFPFGPIDHPQRSLGWRAILIDPPYTPQDAAHYAVSPGKFPTAAVLLRNAHDALQPGGRVGILHQIWPRPPVLTLSCVAVVSVLVGFNNRGRLFSVYEKT